MASVADVMLAVETGADAIGMIFAPSVRRIAESAAKEIAQKLPPFITPVGVFVNPTREQILRVRDIFPDLVVQLHGEESPSFVSSLDGKVIKAIRVAPDAGDSNAVEREANLHPRAIVMFDTAAGNSSGGTGVAFPWKLIAPVSHNRPVIVAGGLTPANVALCVRAVHPYGVDVRSGVETDGRKDPKRMRDFVKAVRDADAA
jgi:phosphoribosylanthranilate isomerase